MVFADSYALLTPALVAISLSAGGCINLPAWPASVVFADSYALLTPALVAISLPPEAASKICPPGLPAWFLQTVTHFCTLLTPALEAISLPPVAASKTVRAWFSLTVTHF